MVGQTNDMTINKRLIENTHQLKISRMKQFFNKEFNTPIYVSALQVLRSILKTRSQYQVCNQQLCSLEVNEHFSLKTCCEKLQVKTELYLK